MARARKDKKVFIVTYTFTSKHNDMSAHVFQNAKVFTTLERANTYADLVNAGKVDNELFTYKEAQVLPEYLTDFDYSKVY